MVKQIGITGNRFRCGQWLLFKKKKNFLCLFWCFIFLNRPTIKKVIKILAPWGETAIAVFTVIIV